MPNTKGKPRRPHKKKPHSAMGGAVEAVNSLDRCDHDWRVTSVKMEFAKNYVRISKICERCRSRETEYQSFDKTALEELKIKAPKMKHWTSGINE